MDANSLDTPRVFGRSGAYRLDASRRVRSDAAAAARPAALAFDGNLLPLDLGAMGRHRTSDEAAFRAGTLLESVRPDLVGGALFDLGFWARGRVRPRLLEPGASPALSLRPGVLCLYERHHARYTRLWRFHASHRHHKSDCRSGSSHRLRFASGRHWVPSGSVPALFAA